MRSDVARNEAQAGTAKARPTSVTCAVDIATPVPGALPAAVPARASARVVRGRACEHGGVLPAITPRVLDSGLQSRLQTAPVIGDRAMNTLSIGQLAKRADVAIDTVRYYERSGLLRPADRLPSGYRRYGEVELKRLRFIRRAKALGFTLEEVRELLALGSRESIAEIKRAAESKLEDLDRRLAELQRIRQGLCELVDACPGHGRADACPILNALTREEAP